MSSMAAASDRQHLVSACWRVCLFAFLSVGLIGSGWVGMVLFVYLPDDFLPVCIYMLPTDQTLG